MCVCVCVCVCVFVCVYIVYVSVIIIIISFLQDLFLESPGDGKDFVYSPVDVNATFHCAVNNTILLWFIDMLLFDNSVHGGILNSREIFQSEQVTSSDGVTRSSVTVFGSLMVNNNTRICCQSLVENNEIGESCTTLILYGR